MKRKIKAKWMQEALYKVRGLSESERLLHRLHGVILVLNGYSASEVARIYKDSPRAVSYWVKRFQATGVEGLRSQARPGRPGLVSVNQLKELKAFVRQQERSGKAMNAKIVSQYIKSRWSITLTERHCWRILKQLKA